MPRPFTTEERDQAKAAHVTHVARCEALDLDETWIDVADVIPGVNPFVGASVSNGVDSRAYAATIRIVRGYGVNSTAPLNEDSDFNKDADDEYFPRLNIGTRVRLYTYTLAPEDDPSGDTIKLAFDGRIDDPDWTDEVITLTCRDLGGKLLDTIVTDDRTYGDEDDPVPAADVAQQFLTDNADILAESITLSVPVEPEYLVTKFQQVLVSVMDALNTLAMLFGHVIRYEFNEATDAFELMLLDPQRDKTVPDYTLEATEYLKVDKARLDSTNLRNHIIVWYVDGVTGEAAKIEVSDSGSIAAFGRRTMQLGGEQLASITNGNDALALAQFALSDLSTPLFDHQVTSTYTYFARVGDLVGFVQNGVHYSSDQALALVSFTHEFPDGGAGAATTSFQCRGKPAGAYERWLRLQGGPVFPQIPPAPQLMFLLGEETQFGGTTATVDGGVWLGYRMPVGVDEIRVHVLQGDGAAMPVPNIDGTTLALTIRRPEGDIGTPPTGVENQFPNQPGEYASLALMSTHPGLWKRIVFVGVRGGLTSTPVIPAAVQAVDPTPVRVDGTIAALSVVRSGSTNTVTVTPGTLDGGATTDGNWVCIERNKHILPPFYVRASTTPIVFVDSGLPESADYEAVYEAFIWNGGQSGPKRRTIAAAPTIAPPQWALGTPVAAVVSGVTTVQLSWTASTPGAGAVRVEASLDRIATRTVGQDALASGTVYDTQTGPKLYRLVALDVLTSAAVAYSDWIWYTGLPTPLSNPAAIPQFTSGTPKVAILPGGYIFAPEFRLRWSWACATSGAAQIRIQRSDDNGVGDPWTNVPGALSASVAAGTLYSQDSTLVTVDTYYRIQALTAAGAVLVSSAATHYVPA